jgi:ERCC4-type nuclease
MIVKIDVRENSLLEKVKQLVEKTENFKCITIQSEQLPIGDIIINDGNEDRVIIERKSVNDLLSSIKDGRYEEQSYRLNGLDYNNHNIIYLIEGDIHSHANKYNIDNKTTFYSAMFSLNYYKGFSVMRSFTMDETATMICNMAYKINKNVSKLPYYSNNTNNGNNTNNTNNSNNLDMSSFKEPINEKNYVNVVKKIKKDNITPDNIGELMLCQIPGISSKSALAIMDKYKTISNLIKELELNNETMKDLSYTNENGQTRKINKTIIENIVKFLLCK